MKLNTIGAFLFLLFLPTLSIFSCKSDEEIIKIKTQKIITAIRDSNFNVFEEMLSKDDIKKSNEIDLFYFNVVHDYMNRYFKKNENIPFSQPIIKTLNIPIAEEVSFYANDVSVPLFTGFDSSNGLKRAVLILTFGNTVRFSKHTYFRSFLLDEDLDVPYRIKYKKY